MQHTQESIIVIWHQEFCKNLTINDRLNTCSSTDHHTSNAPHHVRRKNQSNSTRKQRYLYHSPLLSKAHANSEIPAQHKQSADSSLLTRRASDGRRSSARASSIASPHILFAEWHTHTCNERPPHIRSYHDNETRRFKYIIHTYMQAFIARGFIFRIHRYRYVTCTFAPKISRACVASLPLLQRASFFSHAREVDTSAESFPVASSRPTPSPPQPLSLTEREPSLDFLSDVCICAIARAR